jgi:hypothetical protein
MRAEAIDVTQLCNHPPSPAAKLHQHGGAILHATARTRGLDRVCTTSRAVAVSTPAHSCVVTSRAPCHDHAARLRGVGREVRPTRVRDRPPSRERATPSRPFPSPRPSHDASAAGEGDMFSACLPVPVGLGAVESRSDAALEPRAPRGSQDGHACGSDGARSDRRNALSRCARALAQGATLHSHPAAPPSASAARTSRRAERSARITRRRRQPSIHKPHTCTTLSPSIHSFLAPPTTAPARARGHARPCRTSRRACFAALLAVNLAVHASFAVLAPFFPQHAAARGLGDGLVGAIFGAFAVAVLLAAPFARLPVRARDCRGAARRCEGGRVWAVCVRVKTHTDSGCLCLLAAVCVCLGRCLFSNRPVSIRSVF